MIVIELFRRESRALVSTGSAACVCVAMSDGGYIFRPDIRFFFLFFIAQSRRLWAAGEASDPDGFFYHSSDARSYQDDGGGTKT